MVKIPPMKHIVQTFSTQQNLSTTTAIDLAIGTLNPDPYANPGNQVRPGSIIRVISLAIDWNMADAATHHDSFEWYVWFNVNGAQTPPDPQNVNLSHLKNQVLHQDGTISTLVVLTAVAEYNAVTAKWRLVIKIPKWAQQINQGDKISLVYRTAVNSTISDYRVCAIYKEIFP